MILRHEKAYVGSMPAAACARRGSGNGHDAKVMDRLIRDGHARGLWRQALR
jgi:hypothetical protein